MPGSVLGKDGGSLQVGAGPPDLEAHPQESRPLITGAWGQDAPREVPLVGVPAPREAPGAGLPPSIYGSFIELPVPMQLTNDRLLLPKQFCPILHTTLFRFPWEQL